ncbi:hypothetical protein ACHWQZ_G012786 [Mnemiopsis leidyi]
MDIVVVDEHYEPIVSLIDHVPSDHEYLKTPNSCTSDPLEVEERPSSICVDLNEEVQISKHGHLTDETKFSTTKRKSFGRKLVGYAESIRGSIPSISRPLKGAKFSKLGLQDMKETEDIEKDMKRLFMTKRKLELGYITFCSLTTFVGLVAMTLYDHIHFAMFGIWVACFLLDVVIVALSLLYGNIQLNRKY